MISDAEYTLINDNCLSGMKKMKSESVDMVLTSPPYDNLRDYNGFEFDFEGIAKELVRVLKKGGVIVWIVSDATINGSETGTSFKQALYFKDLGLNIHDTMIWKKESCAFPETTRYYQNFEYMFILSKGKPKTINLIDDRQNRWAGTKVHGTFRQANGELKGRSTTWKEVVCKDYGVRFNVWEIPTEKNNKTGHPAVFPRAIARDHILSWSGKGDVVLDPFSGSGTTAIEAINNDRQFIGFEISEEYYKKSKQRINDEVVPINLFGCRSLDIKSDEEDKE